MATESSVYLASNLLNSALPFLLLPVLTRYLSPEAYGQVGMFQALVSAMTSFVGLNVVGAASRKYFDSDVPEDHQARFVGSCVAVVVASTVATFLAVAIARTPLAGWLGITPGWVMTAVLVSAAGVITSLRLGQWQVRRKAGQFARLQVGVAALNAVLSVALVICLELGGVGQMAAIAMATAFAALVSWILLARDGMGWPRWCYPDIRQALYFGVPLIPHTLGLYLLSSAGRVVVKSELGVGAAGLFMVAVQLSLVVGIIADAFNKAYVPWLYERLQRGDADELRKVVRGTYLYLLAGVAVALLAFAVGPRLVTWVAGERFARAAGLIGWMVLAQAFSGMYLMVTNYAFFAARTGLLAMSTLCAGAASVLLVLTLSRIGGLEGAAIGYALGMLVRLVLTWFVAQRAYPMPWGSAFASRRPRS